MTVKIKFATGKEIELTLEELQELYGNDKIQLYPYPYPYYPDPYYLYYYPNPTIITSIPLSMPAHTLTGEGK